MGCIIIDVDRRFCINIRYWSSLSKQDRVRARLHRVDETGTYFSKNANIIYHFE